MCRVLNRRTGNHDGAIYIGSGSKWGNPFVIGTRGNRTEVIAMYGRGLADQRHLLRALNELRGRDLQCWCAQLACHGDLLKTLANASHDERIAWWRGVRVAA